MNILETTNTDFSLCVRGSVPIHTKRFIYLTGWSSDDKEISCRKVAYPLE